MTRAMDGICGKGGRLVMLRAAALAAGAMVGLSRPALAQFGTVTRVSIADDGTQGNHDSFSGFISASGRFVTFFSNATTLVPGDTNQRTDTFVFDSLLQLIERVSIGSGGVQANSGSSPGGISWDGRFVLYGTGATNIIVPDLNGTWGDLILRDRLTGAQQFVALGTTGTQGNLNSNEGRLTPDARFVVFASTSTDLVPNDSNGKQDIFVRDLLLSITTRESVSSASIEADDHSGGPTVSGDGRFVAFWSHATNLVPGDTNSAPDMFVHDRVQLATKRVSVSSSGTPAIGGSGAGAISSSGLFVVFESGSPDLVPNDLNGSADVFLHDLLLATTVAVSVTPQGVPGNGTCEVPTISADGRFIAFASNSSNLVLPSTSSLDVYVRDMQLGVTRRASQSAQGLQGNGQDRDPQISPDGRLVCFSSFSNNLVPGDTNNVMDTMVQEAPFTNPYSYCPSGTSALGCSPSLTTSGLPSATAASPFSIQAAEMPSHSRTLLIYAVTSAAQIPFSTSWLCVAPPLRRVLPNVTGGNGPQFDCTGAVSADFNSVIQGGLDPTLVVGQRVWLQVWIGDRFAPLGVLSSALAFDILQ